MIRNPKFDIRNGHSRFSELGYRIREEALNLGFFKAGIAPARPLPHPEHLDAWLKEGFHGGMRYMERQASKRLNPALLFPGVRSLVLLAMNYHTSESLTDEPLKGRISRHAWGGDYHEIIKTRLERLLEIIRMLEPSAAGLCHVDTDPVMEKVWGAQSSLGWMGKHTNLITRERGSWFFLGMIQLNIDLEYDVPERDYCGKCRRCIDACPTGAIVAPHILDARRCISYLTIELRGLIPEHMRPMIGNRIYGCDACQEVCPWNKFAEVTSEKGFRPRTENLMPDLIPLVHLTDAQFRERYKGSPVLRAKRDGFVRNVTVALGNSGSSEAIPALEQALLDPSPLVRSHAEWGLKNVQFHADRTLNPEPKFADNTQLE